MHRIARVLGVQSAGGSDSRRCRGRGPQVAARGTLRERSSSTPRGSRPRTWRAAIVRVVSLEDDASAELRELEHAHQLRVPRVVDGPQGPVVHVDGVEVLNFASNDYLGLAGDPRLARA